MKKRSRRGTRLEIFVLFEGIRQFHSVNLGIPRTDVELGAATPQSHESAAK